MASPKTIYNTKHKVSSVFMLLALVWLTVCLPVVYAQQQLQKQQAIAQHLDVPQECDSNPLTNTTEEKTGNSLTSFNEEYLHELYHSENEGLLFKTYYKCHAADVYLAYHPELISPPPNA